MTQKLRIRLKIDEHSELAAAVAQQTELDRAFDAALEALQNPP
jgi:hypothetical protein